MSGLLVENKAGLFGSWLTQHACNTSAHAQGLYFLNGDYECELHNKNAFF